MYKTLFSAYHVIFYKGVMYGDEGYLDWWEMTPEEILSEARCTVMIAKSEKEVKEIFTSKCRFSGEGHYYREDVYLFIKITRFDTLKAAINYRPTREELLKEIRNSGSQCLRLRD